MFVDNHLVKLPYTFNFQCCSSSPILLIFGMSSTQKATGIDMRKIFIGKRISSTRPIKEPSNLEATKSFESHESCSKPLFGSSLERVKEEYW